MGQLQFNYRSVEYLQGSNNVPQNTVCIFATIQNILRAPKDEIALKSAHVVQDARPTGELWLKARLFSLEWLSCLDWVTANTQTQLCSQCVPVCLLTFFILSAYVHDNVYKSRLFSFCDWCARASLYKTELSSTVCPPTRLIFIIHIPIHILYESQKQFIWSFLCITTEGSHFIATAAVWWQ